MKNVYTLLTFTLFSAAVFAQVNITGNTVIVSPQFEANVTYNYNFSLKKIVQNGEETNTEVEHQIPIKVTMYSQGDGFNLFEWESQPMLFFKNNEDGITYNFPTETIKINYRTDEDYVLGEVSNYDEVLQGYTLAYQKLYEDETANYDDLASKSALYFVQMFHLFFGQEFSTKNKEQMMNLFFNPMKNTFSASEDAVTFSNMDEKTAFNFIQTYNAEMEDNSAKMMNHKTIDSYRNNQTAKDYEIKAWGSQSFNPNGLINQIERVVEVKKEDKTVQFIYNLSQN